MCRMQCALALVALSMGLVHSWEFVTATGNRLDFYTDRSITHTIEDVQYTFNITALTYDAVHNTLLFVDKHSDNASIFSFNISTNKSESLVTRKNIEDITIDPVKELLFWTDIEERSIYWMSLKPGCDNNVSGNVLIKMDDEIPMAIAVDSCRGYIYWTNINLTNPTIERARFNGTEREVVVDGIDKPVSLAIDQQTKKILWAEDKEGKHYKIKSADLNGNNRIVLITGNYIQPKVLTVLKDYIYIAAETYIWDYSKNFRSVGKIASLNKLPSGIAANYKIEEQTQGINECASLMSLLQINSAINDSLNIPTDVGLSCVYGPKVNEDSVCKCTPCPTCERCNVSICQNYCLQGNCTVSADGQPECRCSTGYSGERCEVNVCFNYCLNNGVCFLNEELYEPVCQCTGNYEGLRCEAVTDVATNTTATYNAVERNLTLVDLVSNRRKTTAKFSVILEIESP